MDEVMTVGDVSSSHQLASSPRSIIPSNLPLLSALLAFSIAQFLKLLTTWFKEKRWQLQQGTQGSTFALAVILSVVVMYDASGVRLHAGRQAELLNQIVCELPPEHPLSNARPLRELLGHTPPQVAAGAVLGYIVSYLMTSSG